MGTSSWSISKPARNRGMGAGTVRGAYVDGGAHTSTTTVSDLTNGAAGGGSAIVAVVGDLLTIQCDEAARINFGSVNATATAGLILYAGETADFEVPVSGAVTIIDVA